MATLAGTSHVDLSVSNLDQSIAFYEKTLGLATLARVRNEEESFEAAYLAEPKTRMIIGLVQHDAAKTVPFDPRVTGLDHLSFAVADRDELKDWAGHLDSIAVSHGGVTDQPPFGAGLNFLDPDGIALEFYWISPEVMPAP
jgi:catechol-2,3-dioxygenase